jgi:hypothetical protein
MSDVLRKSIDEIFGDPKFKDKLSNSEFFTGVITDVDYRNNVATVDAGYTIFQDCLLSSPQANIFKDANNKKRVYGQFHNFYKGAIVLGVHLKRSQFRIIFSIIQTLDQGQYQQLIHDTRRGVKRLPIKNTLKRDFDTSAKTDLMDVDIVKWGEYLVYSSGLAAFLMDYVGNVLFETEKELHIKVGDRNTTTGIIDNAEIDIAIGRVLEEDSSAGAIEDKTLSGKNTKVKIDVNTVSGGLVKNKFNLTVNADGDCTINNTNVNITINADGTIDIAVPPTATIKVNSGANGAAACVGTNYVMTQLGPQPILNGTQQIVIL